MLGFLNTIKYTPLLLIKDFDFAYEVVFQREELSTSLSYVTNTQHKRTSHSLNTSHNTPAHTSHIKGHKNAVAAQPASAKKKKLFLLQPSFSWDQVCFYLVLSSPLLFLSLVVLLFSFSMVLLCGVESTNCAVVVGWLICKYDHLNYNSIKLGV